AVALTLAAVPAPTPYSNATYGFSLDPKLQYRLCADDPPAEDRGFFLLLEAEDACPFAMSGEAPFITVSAAMNALEDRSLKEQVDRYCLAGAQRVDRSGDLRFPGLASASCRFKDAHGRIHLTVFALAKRGSNAADWIEYQASLTTTATRWRRDLASFRAVLAAIRIAPPN